MKKTLLRCRVICVALLSIIGIGSILAQETKDVKDSTKLTAPKTTAASNMMLNASADNGPRVVNIGLPASVGGTTILENGLPVVYDFMGQSPVKAWRRDASIVKFGSLNVSQTAIQASDVGVSVSTYTNKGTDKFKGSAGFTTNSFGLLRGEVGVSGPLQNGFYYSLSAFMNMDPGTFATSFSTFTDKMQLYKGVINKKYSNGEIGIQYKFAYDEAITTKQSPYIYHQDGKVTALDNFKIGRGSYLEQSGKLYVETNPFTKERAVWDAMKDLASTTHAIDLLGNHQFDNGMILDYTVRYQYAKSGQYNPYLTKIEQGVLYDTDANALGIKGNGMKRYYYAKEKETDQTQPYGGYVQNAMMIASPSTVKNLIMARFELSKKSEDHHWMVGLHNWNNNVDNVYSSTYNYQFEVNPNPRALMFDQVEFNKYTDKVGDPNYTADPTLVGKLKPGTGKWVTKTDIHGNRSYNNAYQYYDGWENKLALVATEKWKITDKFTVEAGTRLEWNHIDGKWLPAIKENDPATGKDKYVRHEAPVGIKKNKLNKTFTGNIIYKAFDNFGFLGDVYYIEQSNKLSSYAGADDPGDKTSVIPGFSAGIYFNHPMVSVVSKFTQIKRTNFINNSTFNHPTSGEVVKQTNSYDVSTIGWTTDAMLTPFKGFNLHLLLTIQNPKYKNYAFEVFGDKFDFEDNTARSVSKTIIEIDPSYTFGKFRVWGSARYFSEEQANYPNTLVFAGRWETFAGLNYKYDKNVDFSLSAVNLLNQKGAQGSISGTNTTTAEQAKALYEKPLCGTYIRPFTIEFKTKVKF